MGRCGPQPRPSLDLVLLRDTFTTYSMLTRLRDRETTGGTGGLLEHLQERPLHWDWAKLQFCS